MRLLLSLLLILAALPLDAAFYSNALGMDLGEKEALDGKGYEGEREGDTTAIYKDGSLVLVRLERENGYALKEAGREEIVITDSEGRRLSRTVSEDGRTERAVYGYEDGRLSSVTISTDDGIQSRIEYTDSADGLLAGLSGGRSALFGSSFYLYELEDGLVKVSYHEDGTITGESISRYEAAEDGSWKAGGIELDPSGNTAKVEDGGAVEEYSYTEAGALSSIRRSEGDSSILYFYDEEGRLSLEEHYLGGAILRSFDRTDPGAVTETRYEDGIPAYRLSYDGDGKRIRKVEKLI